MSYAARDPVQTRAAARLLARSIFRRFLWQGRLMPALWTIASLISLSVNLILLAALLSLGRQVFTLKQIIGDQLVGGLQENFRLMDEAVIQQTIPVDDTIPVQFDLPVQTNTRVVLTEPTLIRGAQVNIAAGVLNINAPADIILPAGTSLPIALDINVPVDTTIPVQLSVDVSIPLNQTGLHAPFVGLQNVVAPYDGLLDALPNSWEETSLCSRWAGPVCAWLLSPK